MDTNELAIRAGAGDREAERLLFLRARPFLMNLARERMSIREDAEDLVAEVEFRIARNLSRFDPSRATFLTWARVILTRLACDHWRRLAVRPRPALPSVGEAYGHDHFAGTRHGGGEHADPCSEAEVAGVELRVAVEDYCRCRPTPGERRVVWEVLVGGRRSADLKRSLPDLAGNVDRWVGRARRRLSAELGDVDRPRAA